VTFAGERPRTSDTVLGAAAGLGSAALFGISGPIAKLLLPRVDAIAAGLVMAAGVVLLVTARREAAST
jgi:drug/metabolite transporter (DMT)-like permease